MKTVEKKKDKKALLNVINPNIYATSKSINRSRMVSK